MVVSRGLGRSKMQRWCSKFTWGVSLELKKTSEHEAIVWFTKVHSKDSLLYSWCHPRWFAETLSSPSQCTESFMPLTWNRSRDHKSSSIPHSIIPVHSTWWSRASEGSICKSPWRISSSEWLKWIEGDGLIRVEETLPKAKRAGGVGCVQWRSRGDMPKSRSAVETSWQTISRGFEDFGGEWRMWWFSVK